MKKQMGKEVQKRWRSIRDSYTKMYRQGKCAPVEQYTPGSRRYNYHRDLAFLRQALQNKKPRFSQDKTYESYSEVSNSPQHPAPEEIPRIKAEIDKPLDLKTKPDNERMEPEKRETKEKPETVDKCNQTTEKSKPLEIKIDANSMSILPEDHFDDDKLFMNSLIPCFKKMNDDTRLLCRIEVLKIIRYALQGNTFEAKVCDDSFYKNLAMKEEVVGKNESNDAVSTLSMTTRSADGSRPIRKRRIRSPSPLPVPIKKRGPGRPRKIRPPPSDSEEEQTTKKRAPKLKVTPVEICPPEVDDAFTKLTSVDQLSTSMFMQMYHLNPVASSPLKTTIKMEPAENDPKTV